ncbi:hypothetical protein [Variovorax sp.]|uniref:hypothetical protein n=1 Tax=Variovorax sp. TaxID=1871043 RepID=UPI003BA99C06
MPETQYARGLWGQFTSSERPFDVPNGMEDNLRLLDDHIGLYTLTPPAAPGTPFAGEHDGDGQIYTDGTYAIRNAGVVRIYPPRKGVRVVLAAGTESWLNTGEQWEAYSVVDTSAAVEAAQGAIVPLVRDAESARDGAQAVARAFPDTAAALSNGVKAITSLVGGSGGTNGTFSLAFLGGGGNGATGMFVVAGGAVVSVVMLSSGSGYTSAPVPSFAASTGLIGASAVAVIGVNAAPGEQFTTPSPIDGESAIVWINNAGTAQRLDALPSADAITNPIQAGKVNAWPDRLFRHLDVATGECLGQTRMWKNTESVVFTDVWSKQRSSNPRFDGFVLVNSNVGGATKLCGPAIALADLQVAENDKVTLYVLIEPQGGNAYAPGRFTSGVVGGLLDVQKNPKSRTGAAFIPNGSDPAWLRHDLVVPSGATHFALYPWVTAGSSKTYAIWGFKGGVEDGPAGPSFGDEEALAILVEEAKASAEDVSVGMASLSRVVDVVKTGARTDSVSIVPGAGVPHDEADLYTGFCQVFQTPVAFTSNGAYIGGFSRGTTTKKWQDIKVVLRTHATNPAAAGATVVAVGQRKVDPELASLDLMFVPWRDPITNAPKSVTRDELQDLFGVGFQTWQNDTTRATAGEPRATSLTGVTKVSSWYVTSQNARTGTWLPYAGNPTFAIAAVNFDAISQADQWVLSQGAAAALNLTSTPVVVVPPRIYAVQGIQCNVYIDNLHADDSKDYFHKVNAGGRGQQLSEAWRIVPDAAIADTPLQLDIHDKRSGQRLLRLNAQFRAAAVSAGAGTTTRVLLGPADSWVASGKIGEELLSLSAADPMQLELIGTRYSNSPANRHEGRGGWRVDDYATAGRQYRRFEVSDVDVAPAENSTTYSLAGSVYKAQEIHLVDGAGYLSFSLVSGPDTPPTSGVLTKTFGSGDATIAFSAQSLASGNPFWFDGQVDVPAYISANNLPVPHWIVPMLGVNDAFGQQSDEGVVALCAERFNMLDVFIASAKAVDPSTRLALGIPSLASTEQDAFGISDPTQTAWRYKRNIVIWGRELIARYKDREGERIYLLPINVALDRVNNSQRQAAAPANAWTTVLVARQNNAVHPDYELGYPQIAAMIWAFLKCNA